MPDASLSKLHAANLPDILPLLGFPPEAAALARPEAGVVAALTALEAAALLTEASKLTAYALPKREAVWWACMCAKHTTPVGLPALDREAVEAAEQWVRQPNDPARRHAFDLASRASFGTPETWAAVAAFWSGDSMAPLGQPAIPPPPHVVASAVAGAVALSAVREHPERRAERLRRFLASGREIASGGPGRLTHEREG